MICTLQARDKRQVLAEQSVVIRIVDSEWKEICLTYCLRSDYSWCCCSCIYCCRPLWKLQLRWCCARAGCSWCYTRCTLKYHSKIKLKEGSMWQIFKNLWLLILNQVSVFLLKIFPNWFLWRNSLILISILKFIKICNF